MPHPAGLEGEISGLTARRGQLRQAAALPGSDLRQVLDAAFAELDGAIEALNTARARAADGPAAEPLTGGLPGDRRLLHAVFQEAPVPLFLLDRDGTVRRANRRAGNLLGFSPGYATGKPFAAFVELPARAAVQSQLAAARRTGKGRQVQSGLLGEAGAVPTVLDISPVSLAGDPDQLVVAATRHGSAAERPRGRKMTGKAAAQDSATVRMVTSRLDLLGAATRLVLENATVSESVMLQRCARLLASELAAWVIVDLERKGQLRRQFVIGPQDEASVELARLMAGADPERGSAPGQVQETGSSLLIAHVEDGGLLGAGTDGIPFLARLGATSMLTVPLSDGERCYGALTLAREAGGATSAPRTSASSRRSGSTWPSRSGWTGCSGSARTSPTRCRRACAPPSCPRCPASRLPLRTGMPPPSPAPAAISITSTAPRAAGAWRSATFVARGRARRR